MKRMKCPGCRKENCNGCSLSIGGEINTNKNRMVILPEAVLKTEKKYGYGLVYDLGTTTMAAMLWNLETGEMVEAVTNTNPQRKAGSDVISRIAYALESKGNAKKLQMQVVERMDEMAKELFALITDKVKGKLTSEERDIRAESDSNCGIKEVVVAGNTAMCELLLGLSVEALSHAPFQKAYYGQRFLMGGALGFSFLKDVRVTVLPCIDGFVGADALCVYSYLKTVERKDKVLAVDIGTNGEVLFWKEDKVYACSTAAGPALEGAAVKQGMSALVGAISEVSLAGAFPREDVSVRVIGNTEPKGICGSGLVDALALLKKEGLIENDGYLKSQTEARKSGVKERLCRRICEVDGERCFLLTDGKTPVYLTANDIRQLQLAKGAIRAAMQILFDRAKIAEEEINHCYLAGAFGSYIKIEKAIEIGLIPAFLKEKVSHVGNCASAGAAMALFSEHIKMQMENEAERIIHVELAKEEHFQEYFLRYMEM